MKVGVCADRDLISIPGLRGHGFYDAGDDAVEFEAGFLGVWQRFDTNLAISPQLIDSE